MKRYIVIDKQENILNPEKREMVLLKARPCCNRHLCNFCDYPDDNVGEKLDSIIAFNEEVLSNISGDYGVLEVINSGSIFEVPDPTLDKIVEIIKKKKIKTLYFESFPTYMSKISKFKEMLSANAVEVRARVGIETFDEEFRINVLGKRIYNSAIPEISRTYYSTCLLIGIHGQSRKSVIDDIEIGLRNFKMLTLNVFCKNTKKIEIDHALISWFKDYAREKLLGDKRIEIFLDNNIF